MGAAMPVWGQGVYERSLYLPLNIDLNLKQPKTSGVLRKFPTVVQLLSLWIFNMIIIDSGLENPYSKEIR